MISILIVDDEIIERHFLRNMLKKYPEDYTVIAEASNGLEAIEQVRKHHPDIIILDINMPKCGGLEAAKIIKKDLPHQIIILNSAYTEFSYAKQAIEYNIDSYLVKPTTEEEILSTIKYCTEKYIADGILQHDLVGKSQEQIIYPFDIVEQLLDAIRLADLQMIEDRSNNFLLYLKKDLPNLDSIRLYLVNSLFSIEKTL